MDAREYLARKGLDGERDRERPNTLEEKAWDRARESNDHRPKVGTPHDWEDWERYHEVLAEGADRLEQKIDVDAHRQASPTEADKPSSQASGVEQYLPPMKQDGGTEEKTSSGPASDDAASNTSAAEANQHGVSDTESKASEKATKSESQVASALMASPAARLALMLLVLLVPPLAVAVTEGGARRVSIAFLLTLLGWLPGVLYGAWWLKRINH
ncbi:YqaE/Pmp3 family membrane protein [Halomonas sp. DP5Y7-2]|uniref:YqaE/Pmp3 family membrane protein n=1 Tax=Halomonas sp. DP5Y7-2 TaxID=2859076 RepID=UPI001C9A1120|nr:YqaE/Pmp3 family membrane protein [Halomonas sp. DP5Y7-2]MBY5984799.1 YqaE/Pmp3 family membrane protein [Halomonas sp. DP5Y7-2]